MNKTNNSKILTEHKYGSDIKPIIFTKKLNLNYKTKYLRYVIADSGQTKHFPPSVQEWCNSIYTYDKNYSKSLPVWDKNLMNLLKSYYSMYCGRKYLKKFEVLKTKFKSNRFKRLSINRIFVGKGHLKHTSNKAIVTWYIHSRIEKNFLKRRFRILSSFLFFSKERSNIENEVKMLERITERHAINKKQINKNRKRKLMDSLYNTRYGDISDMNNVIIKKQSKEKITFNRPVIDSEFYKYLQRFYTPKQYKIRELILKRNLINLELFFTWLLIYLPFTENLKLNKEQKNVYKKVNDIKRIILLLKENISSYQDNLIIIKKNYLLKKYLILKYSLKLNMVKSSLNIFVEKLKYLINKIYNKKVEFKLIKLKRLFLSSDIFTQAIALRLKNRNNRLYRVLKSSLSKIKLSSLIPRKEKYKKNKIKKESILVNKIRNKKANSMSIYNNSIDPFRNLFISIIPELVLKTKKELKCWTMTDIHPDVIKYRHMAGIKIEAKGRLTRRFTASRSVFKMRQKGGFKNIDSSFKGLSTVILRGHVKSNGQYSTFNSKRRNGAFGIKGWVSNK